MADLPTGLAASGAVEIKNRLMSISGGNVLDVGTGSGEFIRTLMKVLKDHESFVGIDCSGKEVESAKKQFETGSVEIMEMNAESLDFENSRFDTVCISHSLHHLADIERVLAEMKRVLKSGGNFIIQESFCDGKQTEAQKTEILQHHWLSDVDSLLGISHHKTLAKQELKDIVDKLGLREVEIFESSWYVKCLFCEDKFECENPKNENIIKVTLKEIDEHLNRISNHPEYEKIREESEKIAERLKKTGSAAASHLFCIGTK
ncbi:MAG: class I SAM-dependent methyltransferase [Candidatus Odinarchaeota archaeon]